jgi:processive 1,2-diacylglycerol beta-glucosyltransferase
VHRDRDGDLLQTEELAVKSLLILTASFGEGHNAAARNVREAVNFKSPETEVLVSDTFLEAYGWVNQLVAKGYLAVINYLPHFWQAAFNAFDRTRIVEAHIGLYSAAARRLTRLIRERQPSVIVSTYPGYNQLLDFVFRKRLKRPFETVTIITDSLTVNSVWYRAHSDYFLVANEQTAEVLARARVREQKIRVFGFPVPRIFASFDESGKVPNGPWRILYVVNSGRPMAPAIVKRLLALNEVRVVVTTGRDEDLARRISGIAAELGKKVDVFGWTPEMPRLMAESHLLISKAGGATVQESLAAKTPMIITQIVPGQEEGNARLVLERKAGALATTPAAIAATAQAAFADGGRQWIQWKQAASSLSRPSAADDTAEFLLNLA